MKDIKRIAALGMLTACEVVLSRFLSVPTPFVKLSLAFLPTALAGILWGPLAGAAVGGLGDLIGALLFPTGAYFAGFTLTAALSGACFGSLCRPRVAFLRVALTCGVVCLFNYFILDSVWLYILMGDALFGMLPTRLLKNLLLLPVSAGLVWLIYRRRGLLAGAQLQADKRQARRAANGFWKTLPAEERARLSAAMTERVLALPQLRQAKTVFCFCGTAQELDTAALLDALLAAGKTVALPLCGDDGAMTARRISSRAELREGRFGIPAPAAAAPLLPPEAFDAVLLPGLAFDRFGTRLGRGKAYYDRWLAGCAAPRIGLCPEAALARRLPFTDTDVPADLVVTERRTLRPAAL